MLIKFLMPALILLSPATAQAGSEKSAATATLEQPTPRTIYIVADGLAWRCTDTLCRGESYGRWQSDLRMCKAIANKLGNIVEFGTGDRKMKDDHIADCNQRARSMKKSS